MSMIIIGPECEDYVHYVGEDEDHRKIYCAAKEKTYWYGQCIPCEIKVKKIDNEEE